MTHSDWVLISIISVMALLICVVLFVMVHNTNKKETRAKSTYKESQRIRQDWREARTKSQRPYYYNAVTNESSWDPPSTYNAFYGMDDTDLTDMAASGTIAGGEGGEGGSNDAGQDLPPGWHVTTDSDTNRIFWYHDDGESTTWEKPDWVPIGWVPTEDQWEEFTAEQGHTYYYNARTGTTQWEPPGSDRAMAATASSSDNHRSQRLVIMKKKSRTQSRGRSNTHEREWNKVRQKQDERREMNLSDGAVGLELTRMELTELSQVQDNR